MGVGDGGGVKEQKSARSFDRRVRVRNPDSVVAVAGAGCGTKRGDSDGVEDVRVAVGVVGNALKACERCELRRASIKDSPRDIVSVSGRAETTAFTWHAA